MHDELGARQRAISLRLAGRAVKHICSTLGRSEIELERAILSVRRRLQAHATPATRYRLIGAPAILAELQALNLRPLPNPRTVERVLQRNGLTAPRVRLAPLLPRQEWPGPQARASNELHEVDRVGPVYLKGNRHRYYIWVGKDAFDGAVCLRLASSRKMDEVLWFLGECWKDLGRPEQVQFDNARERAGPPGAVPEGQRRLLREAARRERLLPGPAAPPEGRQGRRHGRVARGPASPQHLRQVELLREAADHGYPPSVG
jgi:hypothetical protein